MQNKDKIKFLFGCSVTFAFFALLLAGLWVTAWYLSVKLILTAFIVLFGGYFCYSGIEELFEFLGDIANG